ncbi:hypothetical protein Q7C18_02825 [Nesterenkonia sp. CL21]|uniref:hypothetical protein n=1 Tax=Nesterenkonia sp. CL21 TaxID=3064894 RepID=UPI00287B0DA0|nr:hypothetical protein [Nesterenkonia sp. CL21]MDS2171623.1 hypothetical protein [Nesterenkonia sp. CL21]
MKIAVVGHHERQAVATRLADALEAEGLFIDEGHHGSLWNHERALLWAEGQDERVLVLEEDALPCQGFREAASGLLERFPDDLVSLYLGTGRPPQWQEQIALSLIASDAARTSYLVLPQLLHGVAYSVPHHSVSSVLAGLQKGPADYSIGNAWRDAGGGPIIYPTFSLVDHMDGPSVEAHPDGRPRLERRQAWRPPRRLMTL